MIIMANLNRNRKNIHVRSVGFEARQNMINKVIETHTKEKLAEKYVDLNLQYETLKKMYQNLQPKLF